MMTAGPTHSTGGSGDTSPKKPAIFLVFFVIVFALVIVGAFLMLQRRAQYRSPPRKPKRPPFPRWP